MIVTRTPLRISLCGGGTDFPSYSKDNRAATLSFAINKYIYLCVKERFDNKIRVAYSQTEIVDCPSQLKHSIVRTVLGDIPVNHGLEIASMADIPSEGTGLGSSSCFTAGLIHALYHHLNISHTKCDIAQKACDVEIVKMKKPIGLQDQWACSLGGLNLFAYSNMIVVPIADYSLVSYHELIEKHSLLFYSGKTREAVSILTEQNNNIQTNQKALTSLYGLTLDMTTAIKAGRAKEVGEILRESWRLKKSFASKITNDEINSWVDAAYSAGAWGSKITGAGGGGFFYVWAPEESHHHIKATLSDYGLVHVPFKIDNTGTTCVLGHSHSK